MYSDTLNKAKEDINKLGKALNKLEDSLTNLQEHYETSNNSVYEFYCDVEDAGGIDQLDKCNAIIDWFKDIDLTSKWPLLVQKASAKYGLPEEDITEDHLVLVKEELREILQ